MSSSPPSTVFAPTISIETAELRVGMFVHLDLGWMSHPFALSSFRITDAAQIATIRALGLARVRCNLEKEEEKDEATRAAGAAPLASRPAPLADAAPAPPPAQSQRDAQRAAMATRRAAVEMCQRQYGEAARGWDQVLDQTQQDPLGAGQRLAALSDALVDKMLGSREVSIRALTETSADRASHALNVGVISLLMGKMCGLAETDLRDLGVGALSHDIGKQELPHHLHRLAPDFSGAEIAQYRDHVAQGVVQGRRMGLAPGALLVIGQHHEHCDGSGFPQGLNVNRMSVAARVVALVNRYDNLCHPAPQSRTMTPHEALSRLFAQGRNHYDATLLTSFVRMMGVYPPGSVVQLTDDRFALVDSVNSSRPLKPRVLVHDAHLSPDAPLLVNLENAPDLGIRRSLPVAQVPRASLDILKPPARVNWFFEADDDGAAAGDVDGHVDPAPGH